MGGQVIIRFKLGTHAHLSFGKKFTKKNKLCNTFSFHPMGEYVHWIQDMKVARPSKKHSTSNHVLEWS